MRALLAAAFSFFAIAAFADPPPRPDYSRQALLRMFAPPPDARLPAGRVQFHDGIIELRAFGMNWRFLPFLAPLPGARLEDAAKLPDPFALTGTRYALTMPPMFDNDRPWAVQRERRRIERMIRKQRLNVK